MRLSLAVSSGFIAFITNAYAVNTSTVQLDDIEVNATSTSRQTSQPAATLQLKDEALQQKLGRSIGDTLKDELGISNQSFGPGVGMPVIRGQAGPRVRVLSNGMGSNDLSALSPDHASSTEAPLAEQIEVLRGPASLLYGSGLMGGAVNVVDNRIQQQLPTQTNTLLDQRFDSAASETTTALKLQGAHRQLAYHLDGFYRQRDNLAIAGAGIDTARVAITDPNLAVINNPVGILPNSQAEALNGAAGLSWITKPGFAGASIQSLDNSYGVVPDGTGNETVHIAMQQQKIDVKGGLNKPFAFAESLQSRFSHTDYQHAEIADGAVGALFTSASNEGRLEMTHRPIGALQGIVGFQANVSDVSALNLHAHGHAGETEPEAPTNILPRSQTRQFAAFAFETLTHGAMRYQLASRVEQSDIQPELQSSFSYTPANVALSALWQINPQHSLNLAVTRFARAPQVQELLSNGLHEATRTWDRGNTQLTEETGYNLDVGYRYQAQGYRLEGDVFQHWANHYIYQRRTGESLDEDGNSDCGQDCVPVLLSSQADAVFKGFEARLVMPVMENRQGVLDLTLFSDYTRGEFVSGGNVPRMPPLRYGVQLDYQQQAFSSHLRLTRADDQPYAGDLDTTTPGYLLLGLGAQYRIKASANSTLTVYAKGNNLLNDTVRNAVSYLRNFAPEAGRGAELGFRVSY